MIPAAILTDIEGTTTPIAFVHRTLFPFARARLPALLRERSGEPEMAAALAETLRLAPGRPPLETLLGWMDADAKIGPLKTLQGLAWREGYADGTLRGALYPDVAPALRAWHRAGIGLFVYSSGSVAAQRLLFAHSVAGDLAGLFGGFFDTAIGGKRDASSYAAIAARIGCAPETVLFLSDVEAELDAAGAAGMRCRQLVRTGDGTRPGDRHPVSSDFAAVAAACGLPN